MSTRWHERWAENNTPWRYEEASAHSHPFERISASLGGLAPGARVLVPLCGDSPVMPWLVSRGFSVVGVDVVPAAIAAAAARFEALGMVRDEPSKPDVVSLDGGRLVLMCADFLQLELEAVPGGLCDAAWDRAALVALPLSARPQYVATLRRVLARDGKVLLDAIRRPAKNGAGPPFSLESAEVAALFGPFATVVMDEAPPDAVAALEVALASKPFTRHWYGLQLHA